MRPPAGKPVTKTYKHILKWLPAVLSEPGTIDKSMDTDVDDEVWTHTKTMSSGRTCRIEATGKIEASTILTLIATVACIQLNDGDISMNDTTVTLIADNAKQWMEKYLGHRNYKELSKDIRYLISYKIFWCRQNGDFTTQAYVYDGELKNNKLKIILKRSFVDMCIKKGLEIEFMEMQRRLTKKPVAKLLYMYLCSNSAPMFTEATLMERCGVTDRRTLKKAFADLLNAKFIGEYAYNIKTHNYSYSQQAKTCSNENTDILRG
jgi:hypothetical protein